jgi:hypothetical protein
VKIRSGAYRSRSRQHDRHAMAHLTPAILAPPSDENPERHLRPSDSSELDRPVQIHLRIQRQPPRRPHLEPRLHKPLLPPPHDPLLLIQNPPLRHPATMQTRPDDHLHSPR